MAPLSKKLGATIRSKPVRPVVTIEPVETVCDPIERLAPTWKLPAPPPGHKWHREDFVEHMLPAGYRPLMRGEVLQEGDEFNNNDCFPPKQWQDVRKAGLTHMIGKALPPDRVPFRTKRPLPGAPASTLWKMPDPPPGEKWHEDTFTEADLPPGYRPMLEGEACSEGDEILYCGREWMPMDSLQRKSSAKSGQHLQRTTRPLPGSSPLVPAPPPGYEWHKPNELKEADLPPGYRPMLVGELRENGEKKDMKGGWCPYDDPRQKVEHETVVGRTKKPLPASCPAPYNNILTPRIDAAEKDAYGNFAPPAKREKFANAARDVERELIVAMDENAYQLSRVNHFQTAANMAQTTIKSLEAQVKLQDAELANVRKELEELKELVIEEQKAWDLTETSGDQCYELRTRLLTACGTTRKQMDKEIAAANKKYEKKNP